MQRIEKSCHSRRFSRLEKISPDIITEWHYYHDGKCWLMKVTRKTKTLMWINVIDKSFRATLYFPAKAETIIEKSDVSNKLKIKFRNAKKLAKQEGSLLQ